MNRTSRFPLFLALIILASVLSGGCGLSGVSLAGATATNTPGLPTPAYTSTATSTRTPLPSATPDKTATAAAKGTASAEMKTAAVEMKTATAAAEGTASVEQLNAALAPYLEDYGVDPQDGHVAWTGLRPVKMELTSYLETNDYAIDEAGAVTDFVLQTRITWNTSGALSLCGITFDAEEDLAAGAQHKFMLMRLQFDPGWTIWNWQYGQFQSYLNGGWQPSRDIHDENDSANLVALVVRGKNIDIYINRDKQRQVEDPQRTGGRLALTGYQESGRTVCTFENSWLWVFDK